MEHTANRLRAFDTADRIKICVLLGVVSGIFGFLYETVFYRIDLGYFVKRGTTLGPWIPIYACGGLLILLLAARFRKRPWLVFLLSAGVSGLLELATGFCLYHFFGGLRLWDYNTEIWNWGNIGGYICARSVLFFGASGLLMVYVLLPLACRLAGRLSKRALTWVSFLPGGLFLLDILVSRFVK